jgi:hypothetical protein
MVIGITVNGIWTYKYLNGDGCACDYPYSFIFSGVIIYGSYLILFLKFFIEKYGKKEKKDEKKVEKKNN